MTRRRAAFFGKQRGCFFIAEGVSLPVRFVPAFSKKQALFYPFCGGRMRV